MADDLGGDALAHLALGLGIDRQREVGMGLDVAEARGDGEVGGVDHLGGLARKAGADGGDAAAADGDVAAVAGGAAAVEDQSTADEHVVAHGMPAVANAASPNNPAGDQLAAGTAPAKRADKRALSAAVSFASNGPIAPKGRPPSRSSKRPSLGAFGQGGIALSSPSADSTCCASVGTMLQASTAERRTRFSAVRVTTAARARSNLIAVQGAASCR